MNALDELREGLRAAAARDVEANRVRSSAVDGGARRARSWPCCSAVRPPRARPT